MADVGLGPNLASEDGVCNGSQAKERDRVGHRQAEPIHRLRNVFHGGLPASSMTSFTTPARRHRELILYGSYAKAREQIVD